MSQAETLKSVKDRILEAAREQFAQFGFTKVTMDEIARAAGMGKASIYYYFPTKDALFQAVVTREYDEFTAGMEQVLRAGATAADKLRSYVERRFSYFSRLLRLNIIELPATITLKPVLIDMFDEFARREFAMIRTVIQEGKDRGEFEAESVDEVARAFLHVLRGLRLCRIREARGRRIDGEGIATLRREIDLVTSIFLRGLSDRTPAAPRPGKHRARRAHLLNLPHSPHET